MQIFYAHDILGYFCILKKVNQVLGFSLPDTTVFRYLTRCTYFGCLFYYMMYWVMIFLIAESEHYHYEDIRGEHGNIRGLFLHTCWRRVQMLQITGNRKCSMFSHMLHEVARYFLFLNFLCMRHHNLPSAVNKLTSLQTAWFYFSSIINIFKWFY